MTAEERACKVLVALDGEDIPYLVMMDVVAAAIKAAVAEEREACAKLFDDIGMPGAALMIRNRSKA